MQQIKRKAETQQKKENNMAMLMAKRDSNRLKEQQNADYIELLKGPRSKEYLHFWKKTTELAEQLADLDEELECLEQESRKEREGIPAPKRIKPPSPSTEGDSAAKEAEILEAVEETKQSKETQLSWLSEEVDAAPELFEKAKKDEMPMWLAFAELEKNCMVNYIEKQQRILQLKEQRAILVEKLEEAKRLFVAQLPVPDRMIGMIYPGYRESILLKYGVIARPGTAFRTPAEMLEQVKPPTKKEEEQWLKGYQAYQKYCYDDRLLIVEIYLDAVCVVYDDGKTFVYQD